MTFHLLSHFPDPEQNPRIQWFKEDITSTQKHIVAYFRLCGRLRRTSEVIEFYTQAKAQNIEFSPVLYYFALYGVYYDEARFPEFSVKVLGDMASEGIKPNAGHLSVLLMAAAYRCDVPAAASYFRKIEFSYVYCLM